MWNRSSGTSPLPSERSTPPERKPLLKRIRFLHYAHTHFFVIVIYFYCPPPPFPPCPARNIVYNNKLFLLSTLILRPALKNNLKNCSQPRSFSKRRDMPLPYLVPTPPWPEAVQPVSSPSLTTSLRLWRVFREINTSSALLWLSRIVNTVVIRGLIRNNGL